MTPPSNVQKISQDGPPSPQSRPSSSSARPMPDDASWIRPSMDIGKASMESSRFASGRASEDSPRGRTLISAAHRATRSRTPTSMGTSDTASTIRPSTTSRSIAPSASEMSAEEHLSKGIACHENGSLKESTYHLRYAARQNNPTAMLLYALACRHGWGMRANQAEGVEWLRKAAEYASIEIADNEDQMKEGKHIDAVERRTRKAQFALSIYELGVSHMNGWGIEQDKTLALRCFEIAGSRFSHHLVFNAAY
jgi:TPR repeat protein